MTMSVRYKKSLDQETIFLINQLSTISISNAQESMADNSNIRQATLNLKSSLSERGEQELLDLLITAFQKAESVYKISLFESEWRVWGLPWSPQVSYYKELEKVKKFLDRPEDHQSPATARYWSVNEERHWLHDRLCQFENSLHKAVVFHSEELKNLAPSPFNFNQYLNSNREVIKRLCQLIYGLIDSLISAYPTEFMERLNWLAKKVGLPCTASQI